MQKNAFICRSCLVQLRTLAPRQLGRYASTSTLPKPPANAKPKKQTTLPASALTLRSQSAPWWMKRRVRKRLEKELYALPKPPKLDVATLPASASTDHGPADERRGDTLQRNDSAYNLDMKKYQYREYGSRASFFRKRRHPHEVQKYNAWKDAFYALRRKWMPGSSPVPSHSDVDGGGPDAPSAAQSRRHSASEEDPGRMGTPADYHSEVRDQLDDLLALEDEEAIGEEWRSRTIEDREASWSRLVMAALVDVPRSACKFLRATWDASTCPAYVAQDAMWFLIRRPATIQSKAAAQDFCDLVIFLLRSANQEEFRLRQWDIFQIMKAVRSDEVIHELYQQLVTSRHPLHRHTRLQFAKRLGETAVFKHTAFEILESLVQAKELDINSPHAAALCTTILTPSKQELEEAFEPGRFVEGTEVTELTTRYSERLLELGFNPNLITYSVLIRDLIQRKEVNTALDVHKIMASQELKPDAVLYSFLLNGAKTSHSWLPMHMLVQQAFLDEIKDPVVWNELLHTVFMAYLGEVRRQRGRRKPGMPAFHPMLKLYANIFQPDLLRKFIPTDVDYLIKADLHVSNLWQCEKQAFLLAYRTPSWSSRGFLDPGYDTLTLMILGYLNSLSNPQSIVEFYLHFKQLLERGDRHARSLVAKGGARIFDYVIRALLHWREHIGTSVGIVSDLLRLSGESPVSNGPAKSVTSLRAPSEVAKPSAVADTGPELLANDLASDQGPVSADLPAADSDHQGTFQPRQTMLLDSDAKPVKPEESFRYPPPSLHTWGILINGLMFHREADKAERVVEIMQEHGVEPSLVTYNTLTAGYANAQDVRKTVKTLQRLEGAGFEGDDFTFRAWAYLVDKESALELMEGAEAERTKRLLLLRQQQEEDQQPVASSPQRYSPEMFRAEMEAWDEAGVDHGVDENDSADGGYIDLAEQYVQGLQ